MTSRVRALLIAAFCGLVLLTRVYVDFPTSRIKLVTNGQATENGVFSLDVPYAPRMVDTGLPIVLIAHLQNTGAAPVSVNIAWNATNLTTTSLKPSSSRRIDLVLPEGVTLRGDDRLRFRGSNDTWQLTYLEVANLHGSARGLINAVFVPASVRAASPFTWPLVLLTVVVFAGVGLRAGAPWAWKSVRLVHTVTIAFVLGLFALSLLSSVVTPYKVLISSDTFWIGSAVVLLRGIWRALGEFRQLVGRRVLGSTAAFDSVVVALIVTAFFTTVMFIRLHQEYRGNYSGFLHLQRELIRDTPLLTGRDDIKKALWVVDGGYDGMFMYLMTYDPFMSAFKDDPGQYTRVVDTPPYRYTRIGFSVMTRVAAWNHPERYPMTMMWLIIASHFVACLALGAILRQFGAHPAWALFYIFIPGFLQSLSAGLPESIAAAFMLAGVALMLRSRFVWAAAALAASLMVRETGGLFVVVVVAWMWLVRRQWRDGFIVGLSMVPITLWRLFVGWRLFPAFGWDGVFYSPGNIGMPFKGVVDLWAVIATGTYFPDHAPLAVAGRIYPILLAAALVVSIVLFWTRRDALTAATVAYALIAVSLDYWHVWAHVGNAERVTYDVLLLLLVAFATLGREARALRTMCVAFFACMVVYSVFYGFDSQFVRAVLFSPLETIF